MPRKIALDYDDAELRIVVAHCAAGRVEVTDAKVISLAENNSVSEHLRHFITSASLQRTDTLVAIGRGKAELRELQLPPVSAEDLPDLVRFQAIRSFATSSDRAIVDFLVTDRNAESNTVIAAAVAPQELDRIRELCGTSELVPRRVALRPLTAASMYLRHSDPTPVCVLIDLLADDAEIAMTREGKVIFVRTVRLPSGQKNRSKAIAGEIRRTMMAGGQSDPPDRIVVWGKESVHADDVAVIRETIGCGDVRAVNPFDLVDVKLDSGELPDHVGRLAPLVGLLASDETAPEMLIDFMNPRRAVVEEPNRLRRGLLIAAPLVAVFLVGFFIYRQLAEWDRKIENIDQEISLVSESAEAADASIARTERIDQFLDSDVSWLEELRRIAVNAPPSDRLMVDSISATADIRNGGGTLKITGSVTEPDVIDELEQALRDEFHRVIGSGSEQRKRGEGYAWDFDETIFISGNDVRNSRYEKLSELMSASPTAPSPTSEAGGQGAAGEPDASTPEVPTSAGDETENGETESVDPGETPAENRPGRTEDNA